MKMRESRFLAFLIARLRSTPLEYPKLPAQPQVANPPSSKPTHPAQSVPIAVAQGHVDATAADLGMCAKQPLPPRHPRQTALAQSSHGDAAHSPIGTVFYLVTACIQDLVCSWI